MDPKLQYLAPNDKDMAIIHKEEAQVERGSPSLEQTDAKRERRVLWKQDLLIIPVLWLIFFLAYLVSDLASFDRRDENASPC